MTRILDYHIGSNHGMVNGGHVYRVGTCISSRYMHIK